MKSLPTGFSGISRPWETRIVVATKQRSQITGLRGLGGGAENIEPWIRAKHTVVDTFENGASDEKFNQNDGFSPPRLSKLARSEAPTQRRPIWEAASCSRFPCRFFEPDQPPARTGQNVFIALLSIYSTPLALHFRLQPRAILTNAAALPATALREQSGKQQTRNGSKSISEPLVQHGSTRPLMEVWAAIF
ncbi:hypothetical protein C8R43DRAFT_955076 [Mycena crocata]|nr:hypothetical protein C8R43DRAFT_955076 [Mycena crocata]